MDTKKTLLLASNSPRRRELIGLLGIPFNSSAADVDESTLPNEAPADYVLRLAEAKAKACCPHPSLPPKGEETSSLPLRGRAERGGTVVIGSDTAVVYAGAILGKPKDASDAVSMLKELRGQTHQVYTAVALYEPESGQVLTELSISDVPMRAYSDAELEAYVKTGDPLDKAGAYAIQNAEFHPVEKFDGCYASVMGLPLCHLTRSLQKMGYTPETNVPAQCQATLAYDCSIHNAILRDENLE
jgi:septum formation protein